MTSHHTSDHHTSDHENRARRNISRRHALALLAVSLASLKAAPLRAMPYTPQGAERKAILDALRPTVIEALGAPIEFVVERLTASGEWAFALVTPQRPGGAAITWAGTVCEGDVSHLIGGLLRKSGSAWSIVATALCPTDVAWATWPADYGAPADLFD